ncbi:MAG: phosphohistidine phosphatase SixA [candidate division WOR-3 bacterium]|nr:phosphohistidine phosphatase SixA [candidate division WOR-3 bacterium]
MELYLIQHGEAKSETEDPLRPLTEKGQKDVMAVAEIVSGKGLKISKIYHSDKLRAKQTAEIIARILGVPVIEEIKGIAPLDDPSVIKELIDKTEENIMIAGHLPHLSRLTSLLIIGNPDKEIVKFQMGGILGLKRIDANWLISCYFTPVL